MTTFTADERSTAVGGPRHPPRTRTSSFDKQIVALAVPASLEAIFQSSFYFVDQVVIGRLGESALAAVGLIGHINFFFGSVLGAVAAAAAIMVAQHHGNRDGEQVSRSVGSSTHLALAATLPLCLVTVLFPAQILTVLGVEQPVVEAGAPYLRIVALTLPIGLLGAVAASTLRSLGDARTPMMVTTACVVANTALSIPLVFGWGPLPAMGVVGAAYATLLTQALRLTLMFIAMRERQSHVVFQFCHFFKVSAEHVGAVFKLTSPIALTGLAWAFGTFIYTLIIVKQLDTSAVAANQVILTTEGLFIVASSGLSVAALTLIGQAVGAGNQLLVRQTATRIIRIGIAASVFFGFLTGVAALILRFAFPALETDVLRPAMVGLLIGAAFQWSKVLNMVFGGGILRAGGDNTFVLGANLLSIYGFGIPLAVLVLTGTDWGLLGVIAVRGVEEVLRTVLFVWRYRSGKWQTVLTR